MSLSNNIIKKRLQARENLETKDEGDIAKEIKGWVLNKGVGESVLHKASRLNYMVSTTTHIQCCARVTFSISFLCFRM
jgi:hypothetical protein